MKTMINNMRNLGVLLICLMAFSGNAWGATTGTFTMSTSSSSPVVNGGVTFTWSSANIITGSGSGFKTSSSMTVTIPANCKITNISKVNGNTWGASATISVYAGSNNSGTKITDIVTGTNSYDISSNNTGTTYYFENSTSKNAWINSLSITYKSTLPQTVTFDKQGGEFTDLSEFTSTSPSYIITEASAESGITLPHAAPTAACIAAGWEFAGWAEAACSETTTSPVMYDAGITYYPEGGETLYAVYRKEVDGTSTSTAIFPYGLSGLTTLSTGQWWQHTTSGIEFYLNYYGIYSSAFNIDNSGDHDGDGWAYIDAHRRIKQVVLTLKAADNSIATVTEYESGSVSLSTNGTTQTITCTGMVTYLELEPNTTNDEAYITTFTVTYYNTRFNSNPCGNIVTLSKGTEKNCTISLGSTAVETCGNDASREVTITVTPNAGYFFNVGDVLTFTNTSGTASASYVSGPTGTGPYTFVYRMGANTSGSGSFGVTSARTYTNYRTTCCIEPEFTIAGTGKSVDGDGHIYFEVLREDLGGASASTWAELPITISSNSSGAISIIAEDGKTAKSLSTWESRAETGGTWAVAATHAQFTGSDGDYLFKVKSTATNNLTGQGTYRIGITQASASAGGGNEYCDATVYMWVDVTLRDKFVDNVNGNATINRDGQNCKVSTPAESEMDVDKNDDCHDTTRRLLGWIKETDLPTVYGTATGYMEDASTYEAHKSLIVAPNTSDIITTGVTWYAVWGEDNTP